MKTLDEAMHCLTCTEPEGDARELKLENIRQFGFQVGSSPNCISLVTAMAEEYLQGADSITTETLILFGLSNFASGVRVGVEMERPA